MSTIGYSTARDDKITGRIQTLTLNGDLTFLRNTSTNQDAPVYRVFPAGRMWVRHGQRSPRLATGLIYQSGWMTLALLPRSTPARLSRMTGSTS